MDAIAHGVLVEDAMAAVGRTTRTYEEWRRNDKEFAGQVNKVRADRASAKNRGLDSDAYALDFAAWRKEFLGYDTYEHQQQWVDVLEGRDPTPIEGCSWDKRNPNRLIVNVPPGHSKSQTITVDYATYRICMNPNVRILIISKKQEFAASFLYQIKQRLTSNLFAKLQATYAPDGGFKPEAGRGSFGANRIYVAGIDRDQNDPTVEALGLGSTIYGHRADLIILDDVVTLDNAAQYEQQLRWIDSEVESRVHDGKILVIGTRLASTDLYSELRAEDRYLSGRSPWSYLRQPMVLAFGDTADDWVTLWPWSSTAYEPGQEPDPTTGLFEMFPGARCEKIRNAKPAAVWALVYQQQQVADDATFQPVCVQGAVDRRRKPGPLTAGAWGHPRNGKEGMYTIATMDPAMAGDTFTVVGSVNRADKKQYLENAWVQTHPTPQYIRETIKRVTEEYGVQEWVIESNAFQLFLTQDPEITSYLAARGVRLMPHYTSKNKTDPDFGVASVATVFGSARRIHEGAGRSVHNGDNLLSLPDPDYSQGVKLLIDELLVWRPGVRGKDLRQDGPMALWFFEIAARRILGFGQSGQTQQFMRSRFTSRARAARRMVVPAADYDSREE
ncbi:hypothetical protein [Cellulomonas sp. WB94]|uniref:hypothetical protein n=1 Tax=Cellulomonas sp. WB94 TaxID=2173174 RepID=UPI0011B21724|nr:hypothetical protein [Cellulomonas sp. WB94]